MKSPPLWGGLAAFLPVLEGVYLVNPENQLMKVDNKVKPPGFTPTTFLRATGLSEL